MYHVREQKQNNDVLQGYYIAYNVKEKEYSALANEVAKGLVRLGGFVTKYQ